MKEALAFIAAAIAVLAVVPYMVDIVRNKTKPNIVSWTTWTLLTAIATAAAFAADEPRAALLTLGASISTFIVVILGLKYGIAKFSLFDGACQAGAIVGLVLWFIFDSQAIALIAALTVDFIAALPTFRHSWLEPAEETWQTFIIGSFAAALTVLSLENLTLEGLLFPIYLALANGAIAFTVIVRRLQLGVSLSRKGIHETLHE